MPRNPWRHRARALALVAFLLLAPPAGAGDELAIRGRVLAPDGSGVAGALVSDEFASVLSGPDGSFALASRPGRVAWLAAPPGWTPEGAWWWPADRAARGELVARLKPLPPRPGAPLALLSDPHRYAAEAPPKKPAEAPDPARPLAVWRRLAGELAAARPDLTLLLGDLAADADKHDPAGAARQLDLAASALALLPAPARAIPGNHDALYQDARGWGVRLEPWRERLGPARHLVWYQGVAVILLDNLGHSVTPDGRPRACSLSPAQVLAWLRGVLALLPPETPLVVASHYPLLSPLAGQNPLRGGDLVQARGDQPGTARRDVDQARGAILALLRGRRLVALVHGHEHALHESRLYTRPGLLQLLAVPAVCGGWWKGDRGWPAGASPPATCWPGRRAASWPGSSTS